MAEPEVMVELDRVTKTFGDVVAVKDVSLKVRRGEFLTLLGPSGCGKTTTLRLIAGFEQPTEGHVYLGGEPVEGKPPFLRDVNTVFQNYALFPHMTVFENVAFGLRMKRVPRDKIARRVAEVLQMVELSGLEGRRPRQLSGGQQQRVAVARAIVNNPRVLLLDEPLGALDLKLRKQMQVELKHLQRRVGITFIYVTHDQEEALTMSDRVAVMRDGVIEQCDEPVAVYERPRSRFVAGFIGDSNLMTGRLEAVEGGWARVRVGRLGVWGPTPGGVDAGAEVHCSVRPERMRVTPAAGSGEGLAAHGAPGGAAPANAFSGRLVEFIFVGPAARLSVALDGGPQVVVQTGDLRLARQLQPGDPVRVAWHAADTVVMRD